MGTSTPTRSLVGLLGTGERRVRGLAGPPVPRTVHPAWTGAGLVGEAAQLPRPGTGLSHSSVKSTDAAE